MLPRWGIVVFARLLEALQLGSSALIHQCWIHDRPSLVAVALQVSLALTMCMYFSSVLPNQSPCAHFTWNLLAVLLSSKRAMTVSSMWNN